MKSEINLENGGNYMEDDLQYLKMITKECTIEEIREMFKGDFNNNTYEIFYNGHFYQEFFRNYKCINVIK